MGHQKIKNTYLSVTVDMADGSEDWIQGFNAGNDAMGQGGRGCPDHADH
jgi:hypothetical protein